MIVYGSGLRETTNHGAKLTHLDPGVYNEPKLFSLEEMITGDLLNLKRLCKVHNKNSTVIECVCQDGISELVRLESKPALAGPK
jgi:hypothetical protein